MADKKLHIQPQNASKTQIKSNFQWRGLYRSVERYVGDSIDCEMEKGCPSTRGESPVICKLRTPSKLLQLILSRRCQRRSKATLLLL